MSYLFGTAPLRIPPDSYKHIRWLDHCTFLHSDRDCWNTRWCLRNNASKISEVKRQERDNSIAVQINWRQIVRERAPPISRQKSITLELWIAYQILIRVLLVWHRTPAYPATQLQTYPLTWSLQLPPFRQGLLEHSLMSEGRFKLIPIALLRDELSLQTSILLEINKSPVWHSLPANPAEQVDLFIARSTLHTDRQVVVSTWISNKC